MGLPYEGGILDLTAVGRELDVTPESVMQFMEDSSAGLLQRCIEFAKDREELLVSRQSVRLEAPIRDVPKLLALAGDYRKHIVEIGFQAVQAPGHRRVSAERVASA